jgi:hypothetical protein
MPAHTLSTRLELARASQLRAAGSAVWRLGRPELDAALPGGIPRAQITEWAGPRSAGKTAALRQLVRTVLRAGVGAVYVDGTGTLTPAPWTVGWLGPGGAPPFWVVRPPRPPGVLAAAEELLASGVFGLVVAEGADWVRTPLVRLQRLARQAEAALVAVVDHAGGVPLAALRVEFKPAASPLSGFKRRVQIRGRGRAREVTYVQRLPYRLPTNCGYPDRRA